MRQDLSLEMGLATIGPGSAPLQEWTLRLSAEFIVGVGNGLILGPRTASAPD
jgi:hypothetical protein